MTWPKSMLVLVAVFAMSCSPAIQRTETLNSFTVPQNWTGGATLDAPSGADWWKEFRDSGLDQAIAKSLEGNIDLRAAAARVEAAAQDARIAGASKLPSLDVSLGRSRSRQNFIGFPIPGGEREVLTSISGNSNLSFGLSWEADVWGRIRAGEVAALASLEARQADLEGARLSLTANVAKVWFTAVEADRQVALARATLESYRISVERVRARFEMGIRPSVDLRLALTELARANALLQQRLEQRDRAIRQVEVLLGDYPSGERILAEDLPELAERVPAGLPSELVHRRPDLIAAERNLVASDARIVQARGDLKPRFSLTSAAGTSSSTLSNLVNLDLMVWNLVGNVTQPLFNAGRLKATVRKNEALSREAAANYESALLRAYSEVESSLAAENVLARQEEALTEATRQSRAARGLSEERYRLGLTDIITLLQSQRTALDSESALLNVRRLRLENRVNLHLGLGGGFAQQPKSQQSKQGGRS